jgi:GcrA cell cycle regulator
MEWNEEIIVRLRGMWAEGHSTAEIGRRLGVSKNAIVGKAHRLDLPARPSPIRRESVSPDAARSAPLRRVEGPTLPPLASADVVQAAREAAVARGPASPLPPRVVQPPPALAAPAPPSPRVQVVAPRPYARVATCCWPIGEPGTRSFRFCDDPAEAGKPYCAEHARLAYVKVRDRREDAA